MQKQSNAEDNFENNLENNLENKGESDEKYYGVRHAAEDL
jgi:hypothetical protein